MQLSIICYLIHLINEQFGILNWHIVWGFHFYEFQILRRLFHKDLKHPLVDSFLNIGSLNQDKLLPFEHDLLPRFSNSRQDYFYIVELHHHIFFSLHNKTYLKKQKFEQKKRISTMLLKLSAIV